MISTSFSSTLQHPNDPSSVTDGEGLYRNTDRTGDGFKVNIVGMANDWNSDLAIILVELNPTLSESQLQTLKVVISPLEIEFASLEKCKSFSDVYRLIEQKAPDQAVSLVIAVLSRIGIPKNQLEPLEPFVEEAFTVEDKPIMDLVLTLREILMNMTNEIYGNFVELVRRRFLRNFHADRLSCRAKLIETLFFRNFISMSFLNHYFEWIDGAGCSNQLETLRRFCTRHRIKEPCWQSKKVARSHTSADQNGSMAPIKCTEGGSVGPQMSESLPNFIVHDGGAGQVVNGTSVTGHVTSKGSDNMTRPFQCTVEHDKDMTSAKVTDVSEFQEMWDEPQQPTSEGKENSTLADNQHTQAPSPPHAVARGERRVLTDLSEPESPSHVPSGQPLSIPIDINPNPSLDPNVMRPKYQRLLDHGKTEEQEKKYRCLTKGEWYCFITWLTPAEILLTLGFVCFLLWISYSSHNLGLVDVPKPTVEYVGSNTTNLLGCFDPSVTKRVHVVEASTRIIANYDAKLYKVTKSDLRTKSVLLSSHHLTFEEDSDQNVAANYWYGDDPVYVASQGKLEFKVTAVNHLSFSNCSFQFYLFKVLENYNQFLNSHDPTLSHSFEKSDCFPAGTSVGEVISFNFFLHSPGFYYIAAHIKKHVEVNITIKGSITSYDTSDIPDEDCSLNSYNHHCTIDINLVKVPGIHVPQHHECILAKSSVEENNRVNVTRVNMDWNVRSILTFMSAILFCLVGLIFLVISCVYCGVHMRVRTRNGYQELQPSINSPLNFPSKNH